MNKKRKELVKKYIYKEELLGILKTSVLFGIAIIAPGVLKIFKDFDKKDPWIEYYPSSIERTISRLYRQGIVEIREERGKSVVKITSKGKVEILKFDLEELKINVPKRWDGKWRLVIFDISNKYKKVRDVVRDKLKSFGFYKFQESVFIYPYPCEKEIQYLREVLQVPHSIKLIRADRIENDKELRQIFKLEAQIKW